MRITVLVMPTGYAVVRVIVNAIRTAVITTLGAAVKEHAVAMDIVIVMDIVMIQIIVVITYAVVVRIGYAIVILMKTTVMVSFAAATKTIAYAMVIAVM